MNVTAYIHRLKKNRDDTLNTKKLSDFADCLDSNSVTVYSVQYLLKKKQPSTQITRITAVTSFYLMFNLTLNLARNGMVWQREL